MGSTRFPSPGIWEWPHDGAPAKAETFLCGVCGADDLLDLRAFSRLPRVTSDCKPWPAGGRLSVCRRCGTIQKKADAKWLEDIRSIYGAYSIYELSSGEEQVIFSEAGVPRARSKVLVDFVVRRASRRPVGGSPDRHRLRYRLGAVEFQRSASRLDLRRKRAFREEPRAAPQDSRVPQAPYRQD